MKQIKAIYEKAGSLTGPFEIYKFDTKEEFLDWAVSAYSEVYYGEHDRKEWEEDCDEETGFNDDRIIVMHDGNSSSESKYQSIDDKSGYTKEEWFMSCIQDLECSQNQVRVTFDY